MNRPVLRQVNRDTTQAVRRERGLTSRGWVVLSVLLAVWNAVIGEWSDAAVFVALAAFWGWFAVRDERVYRVSRHVAASINEAARQRADLGGES